MDKRTPPKGMVYFLSCFCLKLWVVLGGNCGNVPMVYGKDFEVIRWIKF